jgi:hypothetical protein
MLDIIVIIIISAVLVMGGLTHNWLARRRWLWLDFSNRSYCNRSPYLNSI